MSEEKRVPGILRKNAMYMISILPPEKNSKHSGLKLSLVKRNTLSSGKGRKSRSHHYFIRETRMFEKGHSGKMKERAKQPCKISQSRGK